MKSIFFIFLLVFSVKNFCQNADGDKISFHFTPYISLSNQGGNNATVITFYDDYGFSRTIYSELFPQGRISTFNFDLMIKMPVKNFTLAPFLNSYTAKYKEPKYKFTKLDIGCRISYYLK